MPQMLISPSSARSCSRDYSNPRQSSGGGEGGPFINPNQRLPLPLAPPPEPLPPPNPPPTTAACASLHLARQHPNAPTDAANVQTDAQVHKPTPLYVCIPHIYIYIYTYLFFLYTYIYIYIYIFAGLWGCHSMSIDG